MLEFKTHLFRVKKNKKIMKFDPNVVMVSDEAAGSPVQGLRDVHSRSQNALVAQSRGEKMNHGQKIKYFRGSGLHHQL